MELRLRQSSQCLARWSDAPSHRTRRFAFGPTSFPNAAVALRCRVTQIRIGTKPSANSFAESDELGGLSTITAGESGRILRAVEDVALSVTRSEEHTSELQSL